MAVLVVDLDKKSKEVITIEKETIVVDKASELETKINQYIMKEPPTELESKYGVSRRVEVSSISDDSYEVYVAYYQNGIRKLDFRSYFGEGNSSTLNTDSSDSLLRTYLSKDVFTLKVFKDIKTDDEYYLIGDGDYKPDTDNYYIYDIDFNRLFQVPLSTSGIFVKNNKQIDMVEIKNDRIYSLSYGKIVRNLADEELYKYETYIENGKINMNVVDKIKISDYDYENIVN